MQTTQPEHIAEGTTMSTLSILVFTIFDNKLECFLIVWQ
jgi:hypothetical protein